MTPLASQRRGVREEMDYAINEAISAAILLFATNVTSFVLAPTSREVVALEQSAKEQEGPTREEP